MSELHLPPRDADGDVPEAYTRDVFVGRERELADLGEGLHALAVGRGSVFMIVGEPGIGKSRLADELSIAARGAGVLVLWARCWEGGGAPAYWPWVQVLRGCSCVADDALGLRLGAGAADVAQLVPEIRERLPELAELSSGDPERARFHLFQATAHFLKSTAAERPLLLVLDDLHAADRPSLLLLQFLARELADVPVLIIGCYRALEMRRQHELSAVLGDLARHARHVALRGLTEQDIERFIARSFGIAPAARVVSAVHQATDGNPFFVDEVARLLAAEGRLSREPDRLGIPEGVREAIRRRLTPLAADCVRVLAVAAVVGREFDLACVEHACALPTARVFEIIADAVSAEIVEPIADAIGRYRFVHVLIRETLYDDLAPARRIELHRAVGRALEELYGADRDPHLAALAHHFLAAAPGGDAAHALDYCVRAALRATRLHACEEAVLHYERALEALAFGAPDERVACELLLALGQAHDRAGDVRAAKETFARAAAIARELSDARSLARAALGPGGQWAYKFTSAVVEKSDVALLDEALAALDPADSVLRVKVSARLGLKLCFLGRRERSEKLSAQAVEMARRLADVPTLAYTLIARHAVLLGPDHLATRTQIADEMLQLADDTGDRELAMRGYAVRVFDYLQLGDLPALDRDLRRYIALAQETQDPFDLWMSAVYDAARALIAGNFLEGQRRAVAAMEIAWRMPGQQRHEENAGLCFAGQMFVARREMATNADLVPFIEDIIARFRNMPVMCCGLVCLLLDVGRVAEARECFEERAMQDFATVPRDSAWFIAMSFLAQAAHALQDAPRAATLYALLLPYAARNGAESATGGVGAVSRYLGLLATTVEDWDAATAHFEAALAMNRRMGARGWLAHTQHDFGRMLLGRGTPARAHALELLRDAAEAARELGMTRLLGTVQRVLAAPPPIETKTVVDAGLPTDMPTAVLRREGEYWTIGYEGRICRLRDTRGLVLLAHLLRHPGRELHAVELIALGGGELCDPSGIVGDATTARLEREGLSVSRFAGGVERLDARARAAYRARVAELRADLEDAQQCCDSARAATVRHELDVFVHELARSVGIGGRDRFLGSDAERARSAVTRVIKRALGRIAEHHPALGEHLARTVKTGTFCCYAPNAYGAVAWTF